MMTTVQVVRRSDRGVVNAEVICDLEVEQIGEMESLWSLVSFSAGGEDRNESSDWSWVRKAADYSIWTHQFCAVRRDGVLQGIVLLKREPENSLRPGCEGEELLYIEYIEVAPWNRQRSGQGTFEGSLSGVGLALLRIAIARSLELGCEGRLCLHSLRQSEDFYRKYFADVGIDPRENLRYFELTREAAQGLLSGVHREHS